MTARELYVMPAGGGTPKCITALRRQIYGLCWTHDNREIVFSSLHGGDWSLWRVPAAGGSATPIPDTGGGTLPAISRTRPARLAFTQQFADSNIWRMRLPNGAPEQIVASTKHDEVPRFSHDGTKLLFITTRAGASQIWVAASDGSGQRLLCRFGGSPRWSPDDSRIAFENRGDLYVVHSEGGEPNRLTDSVWIESRPAWSPDGRWLYFRSNRSGSEQIWRMPAEGGEAVQLTRGGAWEALASPDGKALYFIRDRTRPGLWSIPVEGGKETAELNPVWISNWTLTPEGIYFVDFNGEPALKFRRFGSPTIRTLGAVPKLSWDFMPNVTVTSDGRWFAWSQYDRHGADLMLIENFR
jgi:Tol biopolymer transport system component